MSVRAIKKQGARNSHFQLRIAERFSNQISIINKKKKEKSKL